MDANRVFMSDHGELKIGQKSVSFGVFLYNKNANLNNIITPVYADTTEDVLQQIARLEKEHSGDLFDKYDVVIRKFEHYSPV